MNKYILPIDDNIDCDKELIVVNMATSNFDVPVEHQKRSSFIFLRNSVLRAEFDFTECSYYDKEEFLLMYLLEDFDVEIDILATTWIEILSTRDGGGVILPSILTSDEIELFLEKNSILINEIYQLINSLPIYSLYCSSQNGTFYNTDDFQKIDYDKIKMANFSKLSKYDAFALLIDGETESFFYNKYFIKGEYYITMMMDRLPFLGLLSALTVPAEIQDDIIAKVQGLLEPPSIELEMKGG